MSTTSDALVEGIAIIGAVGRFPGARDITQFWQNLAAGVESVSTLSDAQLAEAGFDPTRLRSDSRYVPVRGVVEQAEWFDASFFGFTPRDAQLTDPQHRLFLEAAWEALETANCDPARVSGTIGVFAGCGNNTWARRYFPRDLDELEAGEWLESAIGNEKDYVATRVAYKLNLRGPAVSVNTACSTSLVAVCQACQALWTYQCDIALAGGVNVSFPQTRGYYHDDEGISSPDGHTRAFDVEAQGTVFSNGLGIVVLKRLSDALTDGDHILAVISGAAVNNDGSGKASFTAPSADGQADVITLAQAMAGVAPDSVSYVETHGTGTPIGDVIELAGLTKAFRRDGTRTQYCAIGSVKTNIGHVEHAAGVAGLIKTALALYHRKLPASLHYKSPNPRLQLSTSPFFVNDVLRDWPSSPGRRRAGVSSFGVGGTNAHVVVEEPPERPASGPSQPWHLLPLSAQTITSLDRSTTTLTEFLRANVDTPLADVAFSLQRGRSMFNIRRAVVARDAADAAAVLCGQHPTRLIANAAPAELRSLVFMFPGGGAQYVGAARGLYNDLASFRRAIAYCCEPLEADTAREVRRLIEGLAPSRPEDRTLVERPSVGLPMLFAIEHALAQYWLESGAKPTALIGHSVGEYTAACVAGVLTAHDAMTLVQLRGKLFDTLPAGGMLSVAASVDDVRSYLTGEVDLAVVNGPASCVVSGPGPDIDALATRLQGDGLEAVRLHIAVAAHSRAVEPILPSFRALLATTPLAPPRIPVISNVTGTWLTEAQATDPDYWVEHLRRPVQFSDGLRELFGQQNSALLEVGPGRVLSSLARQHPERPRSTVVVESMRHPQDPHDDLETLLIAQARLWVNGVSLTWESGYVGETRRRIPLPTYAFDRKSFGPPSRTDRLANQPAPLVTAHPQSEPPSGLSLPPTSIPAAAAPSVAFDRHGAIQSALREVVQGLSGVADGEFHAEATFMALGFDSLLLTQLAQAIQRKFGIRFKFRRFFEDLATVSAVVVNLAEQLPADAFAPPPTQSPEVVSPHSALLQSLGDLRASPPEGISVVENVIREQLSLMVQQLAMLRGTTETPSSVAPALVVAPVTSAPSTSSPSTTASRSVESTALGAVASMGRSTTLDLTPTQRKYLAEFTAGYTARTKESKELAQRFRSPHADPRTVSGFTKLWKELVYPIVVSRSSGARLWDVDGNEYIDLLCGFGPTFLGHGHPAIVEAVSAQLSRGYELGPQTPLAGKVAALFCELTGQERVSFVNTGSEAVQAALRIARTVTGRTKVATFSRDYHGNFDEMLVRGLRQGNTPRTVPSAPGIPQRAVDDVIVLDYGTPESLEYLRACASELAAIVVEPVQSRRPEFQPREFLHELRRLTTASETLLVFDEVVTGFRVGLGGAQAHFGVQADLATYGKVLGGGLPIGAVAGRADFMDTFDGGQWQYGDDSMPAKPVTFFAGTFARHPLAMAAAWATLSFLKDQGPALWTNLHARAERLATTLDGICRREGLPLRMPQFCSIMYPRIDDGHPLAYLLFYELRARGVYLHEPYPSYLNLAHTDDDVGRVVEAFEAAVASMQRGGFFEPGPTATPPSEPSLTTTKVPLTAGQSEIWLASRISAEASCAFNEMASVNLVGVLDTNAFHEALQQLIARHEALRVTVSPDGQSQRIAARLDVPLTVDDFSSRSEESSVAGIQQILDNEKHQPFDLQGGPLIRCRLIRRDAERHLFVLNAHHLVCDGWSLGILLNDLARLYSGAVTSGAEALAAAAPFSVFVSEQKTDSAEYQDAKSYWLGQFKDGVPVLDLPTDGPRPSVRTYKSNRVTGALSAAELAALRAASARHRCTPFALLFAAYGALLHRLSGQDDVVIGIAAAGQSRVGETDLVGHCVSLLPYRSRLPSDRTATDYLDQTQKTLLDAFEHQCLTFGSLLTDLDVAREPGRVPLVSAIVTHEIDTASEQFAGLASTHQFVPRAHCNFDIELYLRELADGSLAIEFYGNADIIGPQTIERWAGYYHRLLTGLFSAGAEPIDTLPILAADERQRLIRDSNQTMAYRRADLTLTTLFAQQVANRSQAVAVECEGERLTYAELDNRASAVAVTLVSCGVGPEVVVGLMVERSIEMLVALLGILKAGGAYLPLDPTYPVARLQEMLDDSGAPVLVTHRGLDERLPSHKCAIVRLETVGTLTAPAEAQAPVAPTPQNLAYVIYTSGSTGRPKGVEVTHGNVVNVLLSIAEQPGFTDCDSILAVTTLSFDVAASELLLPLVTGGRVVIAVQESLRDGQWLRRTLESSAVTLMHPTPVTWRLLLEAGWRGSSTLTIASTGEPLPRDLADQLLTKGRALWNLYGPTETTIWSTGQRIDAGSGLVPIGRPIANTQVHILDRHRQPVPTGTTGELYIGGAGVARGYRNRPDLTAERFVPDPFSTDFGARLYRTGDLARYRPDGAIECLARIDQQVKVRGYRIELGEIEAALNVHPDVRESAVMLADADGEKLLVGYVTPRDVSTLSLRQSLRALLPEYMVPSAIVALDELPRTPNGKLDRKALPALLTMSAEVEPGGVTPPRNEIEETLLAIWREVLKRDAISTDSNFFDLGGHSLLAIRLITGIEERLGRQIRFSALLEHPTIAGLARVLDHERILPKSSLLTLQPEGSSQPLFLVHGIGGEVWSYLRLAKRMAPDIPVHGLYLNDDMARNTGSLRAMAARYVDEIAEVNGKGPYYLGGFCSGAVIALEMAHQLLDDGKEVGLVVILDHFLIDTTVPQSRLGHVWDTVRNAPLWLADDLWAVGAAEVWGRVRSRARLLKARQLATSPGTQLDIRDALGMWRFPESQVPLLEAQWAAIETHQQRPKPYPGRVVLVKPRTRALLARRQADDLGWRRFVSGELVVLTVPGSHETMLNEPFVKTLAKRLRPFLLRPEMSAATAGSQQRVPSETRLHPRLTP